MHMRSAMTGRKYLWRIAGEIVDLGYKIPSVEHLKEKHIIALTRHWQEKNLCNSTIKNRLSVLRRLAELMDKRQLIPSNKALQVGSRQARLLGSRAIHNPDVSKITDPYVRVSGTAAAFWA